MTHDEFLNETLLKTLEYVDNVKNNISLMIGFTKKIEQKPDTEPIKNSLAIITDIFTKQRINSPQQNIENGIDNLSDNKDHNSQNELEEFMQQNVRKRIDGRYEWRKAINGQVTSIIRPTEKSLYKAVSDYKKRLRTIDISTLNVEAKPTQISKKVMVEPKEYKSVFTTLYELCESYYYRHIKGTIKSERNYFTVLNKYIKSLRKTIKEYSKDDITDFLNSVKSKKQSKLCFYLLRNVFNDEYDKGTISKDIFRNLKAPVAKSIKGIWFNPDEQKLIYTNRHLCKVGNEIEFYILVGCRLGEAFNCVVDFEKNRVYVNRTKRDETSGFVSISKNYCLYLKEHWQSMFKLHEDVYSEEFVKLLNLLKIKRQKNEKPIHRLRHTFATNIYYLGAKDSKKRAYLLGHKSSKITDDIYTDFDPTIKKQDITVIYGSLYPKF